MSACPAVPAAPASQPIPMPLVLDLDGSVGPLPGERRIALRGWEERIRYGCSLGVMARFRHALDRTLDTETPYGTVFLGSGDFHHLSWPLIVRALQARPGLHGVRVLVFDNHPDNMRFPFGVHCGSWVRQVAALPQVDRVDVVGITSGDIGWAHAWENHLAPLRNGKLCYWSVGVDTGWARWVGAAAACRAFDHMDALMAALCGELAADPRPTYLSIDKDVLAPEVVRTNWDQGQLHEAPLRRAIALLHGRLIGSDVTGDVSAYRYRSVWKHWLSRADAQDTAIDAATLALWQADQHALNRRLLQHIQETTAVTVPTADEAAAA